MDSEIGGPDWDRTNDQPIKSPHVGLSEYSAGRPQVQVDALLANTGHPGRTVHCRGRAVRA